MRRINPKRGALIDVRLKHPKKVRKEQRHLTAKIDTGARYTCIPAEAVSFLRLRPHSLVRLFPFDLSLLAATGNSSQPKGRIYTRYEVAIKVDGFVTPVKVKAVAVPQRRDVLLGRDFLQHTIFRYNNPRMGDFELLDGRD